MRKDKERVLTALLTSETKAKAAEKAGVSRRTVSAYLADPVFAAEYRRRKLKLLSDASDQIQRSLKTAVSTLESIISNNDSKDSARIAAARFILEFGLKYSQAVEAMEMLTELEELKAELDGMKKNGQINYQTN